MPNRYERECGYDVTRLHESVREEVLNSWRETQMDHDWWDCVYNDAKRMGALMGVEIDDIQFSGFWSQGDGASFTGTYKCRSDAVEAITSECGGNDEELIRIATELTALQTTFKLQHGFTFECLIQRMPGHYVHSSMMQTGWPDDEEQYRAVGPKVCSDMDQAIERLMRRFANWIYDQLQAEYDYLTSDEQVIESIRSSGLRFDSSGVRI